MLGGRGCQTSTFVCDFCKGTGEVSAAVNARWLKVCALREARKQQGLSQLEQARLLAIDAIDLNAAE